MTIQARLWALLTASSGSYLNYRHQADLCHAYQVLHSHGIPDENIVVMMMDDVAYFGWNPYPGKLYNRPGGPNVYADVPKDYTMDLVTAENFMNILQGKNMTGIGSGKTIASGPNDRIFVYLVDHGARNMVLFPSGPSSALTSRTLINGLKNMHKEKKYKELVFYLESCQSGSMFHDLPPDINVFATTSAKCYQPSFACYWDHVIFAYLGDVYSVKWLEDSDRENLNKETLEKQYEIIKKETNISSTVVKFGDMNIAKMSVADFMGTKKANETLGQYRNDMLVRNPPTDYYCNNTIDVRDIELEILKRRIDTAKSSVEAERLHEELIQHISDRRKIEKTFKAISKKVLIKEHKVQWSLTAKSIITAEDCYYESVEAFMAQCFNVHKYPYALKWFFVLGNLCEKATNDGKEIIIETIKTECATTQDMFNNNV